MRDTPTPERSWLRPATHQALLLIGLLAGCEQRHEQPRSAPPPEPALLAPSRDDSIRAAALDYVRRETAVADATVDIESVSGDWARARLVPADDVTDPALMYLHRTPAGWRTASIGTAFTPDELDQLGIPTDLRP